MTEHDLPRKRGTRALFICGSMNQTTQLVCVAQQMPEVEAAFTPFYGGAFMHLMRGMGVLESTIGGRKLGDRCLAYFKQHNLTVDFRGQNGPYDLYVTCTDLALPRNMNGAPLVVVQEGILDPDGLLFEVVRRFPHLLPRWISGTAATGLSGAYDKFCVGSQGYLEHFAERGAPRERMVVTGMPNFDNCQAFKDNDFPLRDYVLICSSDTRETLKLDSRARFIAWAKSVAAGRPVVVRLHPNEEPKRARREYAQAFPGSPIYAQGNTDAMIANATAVVTQYSSTAFVGLALGKEVHSYHDVAQLRKLCPEQNGRAAYNIAQVCRGVLSRDRSPAPQALAQVGGLG